MKTLKFKNRIARSFTMLAFCGTFLLIGCSEDSVENEIAAEEVNLIEENTKATYHATVDSKWYYSRKVGNNYKWIVRFKCNSKSKRNQVQGQKGKPLNTIKNYINKKKGCSYTRADKFWSV